MNFLIFDIKLMDISYNRHIHDESTEFSTSNSDTSKTSTITQTLLLLAEYPIKFLIFTKTIPYVFLNLLSFLRYFIVGALISRYLGIDGIISYLHIHLISDLS